MNRFDYFEFTLIQLNTPLVSICKAWLFDTFDGARQAWSYLLACIYRAVGTRSKNSFQFVLLVKVFNLLESDCLFKSQKVLRLLPICGLGAPLILLYHLIPWDYPHYRCVWGVLSPEDAAPILIWRVTVLLLLINLCLANAAELAVSHDI